MADDTEETAAGKAAVAADDMAGAAAAEAAAAAAATTRAAAISTAAIDAGSRTGRAGRPLGSCENLAGMRGGRAGALDCGERGQAPGSAPQAGSRRTRCQKTRHAGRIATAARRGRPAAAGEESKCAPCVPQARNARPEGPASRPGKCTGAGRPGTRRPQERGSRLRQGGCRAARRRRRQRRGAGQALK